jgi:hypothetical protein
MRRGWLGTVVVALVAATPAGPAHALTGCSSGTTVVRDGRLRIVGVRVPKARERDRVGLYACLGRGRPTYIGQSGYTSKPHDVDVETVVFDGRRYLATRAWRSFSTTTYRVVDLRRHRMVTAANAPFSAPGDPHSFRVTPSGALVRDDYGLQVVPIGSHGAPKALPPIDKLADDVAYVGNTVYWSEYHPPMGPNLIRSTTVDAPVRTPENRVYDISQLGPRSLGFRRGRCASLRGRVVAATVHVRVIARRTRAGGTRRYACALNWNWVRRLAPRGRLRLVEDDQGYVLSRSATSVTVLHAFNGHVVMRITGLTGDRAIVSSTMTSYGAFAWIERSGRLLLERPHRQGASAKPVVLAAAGDAPTALAASDSDVYWTAGGEAQAW